MPDGPSDGRIERNGRLILPQASLLVMSLATPRVAPRIWLHAPADHWSAAWVFNEGRYRAVSVDVPRLQGAGGDSGHGVTRSGSNLRAPGGGQAFLRLSRQGRPALPGSRARSRQERLPGGQLESGGWDYRINFDGRRASAGLRRDKKTLA